MINIKKLAAIDIGSNGVRLLINYVYDEFDTPIFNKTSLVRMPIRLGADVFDTGKISDANIDRLCKAMKSFRLMMDVYGVENYLAFATSAMREATNNKEIVKKIKKESQINLEIIDGKVEAEMIFDSELSNYVKDENDYLYVDVGGGSTELTLLKDKKIAASKSFPVGTVRLMNGKVEPDTWDQIRSWIKQNIGNTPVSLIGAGGNINHVYKYSGVKLGLPLSGNYLNNHYKKLIGMTVDERMQNFNMKPDRADVVVYALEIYTKVHKWAHAGKIFVPKIGLTDGMIRHLYKSLK